MPSPNMLPNLPFILKHLSLAHKNVSPRRTRILSVLFTAYSQGLKQYQALRRYLISICRNNWIRNHRHLTFCSPPRIVRKLHVSPNAYLRNWTTVTRHPRVASTAGSGIRNQPDTAELNESLCTKQWAPAPCPYLALWRSADVLKLPLKYSKLPVKVRKILLWGNWLTAWSPYSQVHWCQQILFLGHKASNCFLGYMGIPGRGKLPKMTIRP